ncbi:MAG TPA: tetratricopeptide repeat protein, partial [Hyphomonadaceae bacterium]|nr:tetratricopeptide repeat protein [Hyphomonadaceae bacterium]
MMLGRTLLVTASVLAIAMPALAANGGGSGGGEVPSASQGRVGSFDPAKRYAEGVQFLKDKDYKQAEKAFGAVLDVAQRDANTNYMMALAQIGQEDFKNARKYLRNAVKYDANHAYARGWLGAVEARLGDPTKAGEQRSALAAMKEKCASTCPDAATIDAALARIETQLATPDTPLVLSGDLTRFASAKDGDASYLQASALINEGRYEDALYSLRAAGVALGPHADVLTY